LAAFVTERHTVRRASHLIAITPHVARYYGADIRGRVHDIPNAVSPGFFNVARRPERGTLLYAGRIAHGKGIPELLAAVAQNRDYVRRVVLAGAAPDARYRDRVIADVDRLGLADTVSLPGLLDEPALLGEFSRAEALVLPSHQETAPMVVQQAMAAALPVIATRVGGIPDQIEHDRTGWLFEAGDAEQLSALVRRLATDPGSGSSVATSARKVAEQRFRSVAVARATVAAYRSVLAS
jgi:glycosyltransferase involved in cell wall biosynthesis